MAGLTVKHVFQSAKGDGVDATLVQPSNWNASHDLEMDTANILGRKTAGAGPVEELSPSDVLTLIGAASAASTQPLDADLTALAALAATTGLLARTGAGAFAPRTLTGAGTVSVANGDGASANPTISVLNTSAPCGRLSLATGTPVMAADVTSATSIFYTPYTGLYVPLYDGTNTTMVSIGAELSLALDSNAAHTGYHQSGKNFDLWIENTTGAGRLVSGPAWTNDTARATALERKNGFLCNAASMTAKFDATASTVTVPQDRGLYIGTFRASADGVTKWVANPTAAAGGGNCQLLLWNMYQRTPITAVSLDSTDSWPYASATWRAANAAGTGSGLLNRISAVFGQADARVAARYHGLVNNNNANINSGLVGVGVDSITAFSGVPGAVGRMTSQITSADAIYSAIPAIGFHFFQALEYGDTGSITFYGDNGAPLVTQMGLMFEGAM